MGGSGVTGDGTSRRIHYGTGPAPSFLDLPDELLERVVVVYGVSKAYAMTGWRIGLALAPGADAQAMAAPASHTPTRTDHPPPDRAPAPPRDQRGAHDPTPPGGRVPQA